MSFFRSSKPAPAPAPTWSPAAAVGATDGASPARPAEPFPARPAEPSPARPAEPSPARPAEPSPRFAHLRSQFGATSAQRPFRHERRRPPFHQSAPLTEPPPRVPFPEGGTVVIRNCSTKRVLQQFLDEFGGKEGDVSGRYFIPASQDLDRIHEFARTNGFFVKESLVGRILVLDVMVDRARRFPHGGRGGFDEDEYEDERG